MAGRNGHDNKPELLEKRKLAELKSYVELRKTEVGPDAYRMGLDQQLDSYRRQMAPLVVRLEQFIELHPQAPHIPNLETQGACPHFDCQIGYFKKQIAELDGLIEKTKAMKEAAG